MALGRPFFQISTTRYLLLAVAVLSQVITVFVTWPLWNVREDGIPNLPLFQGPEFDFGILMVVSTLIVLLNPKWGIWLNLTVLITATGFDQVRAQPQFLANWLLMLAAVTPAGTRFVRLFLISLWIWAGLHKLFSPDWMTHGSFGLVKHLDWQLEEFYWVFAYGVAISEIGLGLAAWFRPRWAIYYCPLVHVGIAIFLSPLLRDWNYSVIPWNLATAIVGSWIMSQSVPRRRWAVWEKMVLTTLLLVPAGFYVGYLDHGYAHVLYSENIPRGHVTRSDGSHFEIEGWQELAVPFPNERRLLRQYFKVTAKVGDKLKIRDPRRWLDDQYLELKQSGVAEIDAVEFYQSSHQSPAGIGIDSKRAKFLLSQAGARMLIRAPGEMIYAIEIQPQNYKPELLKYVAELPNVEQIQLADTSVQDEDFMVLPTMHKLVGIGLNNTQISQQGLNRLRAKSKLEFVESNHLKIEW